jgi:hypothetical protein
MRFTLTEATDITKKWQQMLYDSTLDRGFREIACVKWIFHYMPSSPLCRLLSSLKKSVDIADGDIDQKISDIETQDANSTMTVTKDGKKEVVQDKTSRATDKAVENRELQKLVKETEAQRSKLNEIFTAIFTAIDCGSTLFEDVILRVDIHRIPSSRYYNLVALASAVANDKTIDTKQKYLLNSTLYDRETAEFNYTLKILDIAHNSSKLSKYFDPEKVDISELFDGRDIKPAGIIAKDPEDLSTIFGTVENWSAGDNARAKEAEEKRGKKSKYPTYNSEAEANKAGEDSKGNVIKISKKYQFDGKEWKLLKDESGS